jgi:Rad3-related DNA helicase
MREDGSNTGALLMGVCRGKLSEGIDFSDDAARCVVVFGIPYPNYQDPKVILKRYFLDQRRLKDSKLISGQKWYNLEATRTINQAIGRVIRHKNDYGTIILADERF